MSRRKRHGEPGLLGALGAFLVGLFLLLVVAEIGLRIVMPNWREYHSGRFMEATSYPGYANTSIGRPGFDGWFAQNNGDFRVRIRINQFGLRNDEPVEAADKRLWVIGDSMSFGWGVERDKSYTQVIADRLGAPTYNVASPGTGVCSWQTLYARMPSELKPKAVVVGLTIENRMGVHDCAKAAALANAPGPAIGAASEPLTFIGVKMFLTRHLALYNFFAVSLKRVGGIETILESTGLITKPHGNNLHGQDPAQAAEMISTTALELANLKTMVPADIPFLVVLFPARFELRDGNEYFRDLRLGEAAALAERGVDTLDLFEDFKAAGYHPTHFAHDGHWSELGHAVAGEAIAKWFAAKGWPKAEPAQ
ncbi:MAG: hypothetical protein EPN20_06235 [Magnetospirillum sp.]|nr:MAG: hypothetical protein EPN20_06235 [Magnetospirillum sp.]